MADGKPEIAGHSPLKSADVAHQAAYADICTILRKHAGTLSGLEVLAIAANIVGKLVALQDQRTVTPAQAMEVVARNIELGNREALETVSRPAGHA